MNLMERFHHKMWLLNNTDEGLVPICNAIKVGKDEIRLSKREVPESWRAN